MRWVKTKDMIVGSTYSVGEGSSDFIFLGYTRWRRDGYVSNRGISADYRGKVYTLAPRENIFKETNTKEETMNKLYEITTALVTLYGSKLAVDSSGKWVMEIKGSGEVKSYDKSQITEVVPYSISIKFNSTTNEGHYFAVKGDWAVGDVVLLSDGGNSLATVKSIDTKSAKATKWITGFKLQGEFIKSGE